jgi:hypothetical protein
MAKTTIVPDAPSTESALIQSFKAARRVSTPLVAIETPDAAATIASIRKTLPDKTPTLAWDCARGLRGLNDLGKAALSAVGVNVDATVNPVEALLACENLPELTVVFMHNLHRHLGEAPVVQALWNLRDTYKMNKRTIVPLGPAFTLPAELAGDIIVLDEPLPTRAELSDVIDQQHKNANLPLPDATTRKAALDAVVGLAHYTAEQVYAMSLERTGANIAKCWERKIKAIENTPGLSVYKPLPGDTTLAELKGIDTVVEFANKLIAANAFNLIVFLDEMDKSFAGGMAEHVGDSGVSKDQVGQILSYMQDRKALGMMLAGVAGTGKTQLPKAMSAASGKPLVILDLGGAKGGEVGLSESRIRAMLKMVTASAEGRVLFIGTANRTTMFTPELNRRFADQFYFDIPMDDARVAIWPVYIKKNGLTPAQAAIPPGFDAGWTGAEIQRACERAALFNCTVIEAAKTILPQAVSAKATIDQMRRESAGRFLSASYPGFYQMPVAPAPVAAQRQIEVA